MTTHGLKSAQDLKIMRHLVKENSAILAFSIEEPGVIPLGCIQWLDADRETKAKKALTETNASPETQSNCCRSATR